jgi:uncharacterized repeat protein (TIGR03803 family)
LLKAFDGTEGGGVGGTLVEGSDGSLYGTTRSGPGSSESGTIFKINPDGSGFAVLKLFTSPDGIFPKQFMAAPDGYFYGTTVNGGVGGYGTLYRVRPDGTGFAVLKGFSFTERVDNLTVGPGGAVYGNLVSSGVNNLIKINANGGLTVIKQFTEANNPGDLALSSGNAFYCIRRSGDIAICRINADGGGFALLKTFTGPDGSEPTGLVQGSDGTLYGVTKYGGSGSSGTLFRLNADGSGFAVLRNLSQTDGAYPYGKLTLQRSLSISSFTPKKGPAGTKVTITGTDFNGVTAVHFNGVPAAFTYVSPTVITATAPAGNASGFLSVTTPTGTATSKQKFLLTPAAWLTTKAQTHAQTLSILYFPNPFSDSFTLQVQDKGAGKVPFRIRDSYGQVVMQGNDLRSTQQIHPGNRMTRGVYYLEVGSGADVKRYRLMKTN